MSPWRTGRRVSPTHQEDCESEGTERGVEGSHVARFLVKLALVEGYIEVESGVDRSGSKVLGNDLGIGRHRGVVNCDCIQRL